MRYLGLSLCLVGVFVGMSVLLGAAILVYTGGQLYWNMGMSLPPGLYSCWPLDRALEPGQLVLLRPSVAQQALVMQVLGAKVPALWLKQVVGRIGQTVCLDDNTVLVDDMVVATRPLLAEYGLGRIDGCWTVGADAIFVLGTHARSWDSRYFGPIARAQIQGICQRIWVAGKEGTSHEESSSEVGTRNMAARSRGGTRDVPSTSLGLSRRHRHDCL